VRGKLNLTCTKLEAQWPTLCNTATNTGFT